MKEEHIHDAIGEISEELIDPVAKLRQRKRYPVVKWAVAAACFCLLLSIPFNWNTFNSTKAESMNTELDMETNMSHRFDGLLDKTEDCSADIVVDTAVFRAKVLEVHDSYILVEPLEQEQEAGSSDRFEVAFPNGEQPSRIKPGSMVEIVYDGIFQEVYPCRIPNVFSIQVVE